VADADEPRLVLTPEQARRRRRRSVAMALLLALLVVLFYVMAIMHGPGILHE
jgi:predicted nucleic acid-binding Zn ribbon protein